MAGPRQPRRWVLTSRSSGTTTHEVQSELTYAIVPAGPGDAVDLAKVHVASWRETYPGLLPQVYLDRMSVMAHARRWRWRLMNSGEITLAAETAAGLVGYCSGDWTRGGPRRSE